MDTLPTEIVDGIIDILQDDLQSLLSCSVLSRCYVTRARQHLFRKVQLPIVGCCDDTFQRFEYLVNESEEIRLNIRELHLRRDGYGREGSFDMKLLFNVVNLLPNLEVLDIVWDITRTFEGDSIISEIDFEPCHWSIKLILNDRYPIFETWGQFQQFIQLFPNAIQFTLEGILWSPKSEDISDTLPKIYPFRSLQSLELSFLPQPCFLRLLELGEETSELDNLRSFTFPFRHSDKYHLDRLFRWIHTHRFSHLGFILVQQRNFASNFTDELFNKAMLHSITSLQSLTLAFKIDIDDCWDGAFRILSSIPSTLQSLELHLGGTVEEPGWDESRGKSRYPPLQMAERAMIKALPAAASRWEELGGSLERFKKLKTLRILHRFVDETPIEYRRVEVLSFPKFTCELIQSNLLEFIGNSKLLFC